MKKFRCTTCGKFVEKETKKGLRKEYSFYCSHCYENKYRFEVFKKKK